MKKLSMFLNVLVCSIGLFQSIKGMDAPLVVGIEVQQEKQKPIQKKLVEKYFLEKHLLENSLPKDLVLFIRQLQAVIDAEQVRNQQRYLRDLEIKMAKAFWNQKDMANMIKGYVARSKQIFLNPILTVGALSVAYYTIKYGLPYVNDVLDLTSFYENL